MNVAVLGTGSAGRTLSAAIAAAGNDVVMGTRDVTALGTRDDVQAWHRANVAVDIATFAAAARTGEVIINATAGGASLEALAHAGADNLAGKVLIDVANALDFSAGMPPSLLVANTDSLGEQIQRAYPEVLVVKALNTVNAAVMVNPRALGDGDHDLFLCGNDADAKATVDRHLREWFGWRSIVDLGDITAARAMEMYLPLWVRLMGHLGTVAFNVKVISAAVGSEQR